MKCTSNMPILSVAVCLFLSGCASSGASFVDWFSAPEKHTPQTVDTTEKLEKPDTGIRYRAEPKELIAKQANDNNQPVAVYRAPNTLYQPSFSHKSLADYAEQLTMELVRNGRQLNTSSKVGIASFVNLDNSLTQTTILGNQLAEMLIVEVQSFGVQVIDFKTTSHIGVGASGDMVFSREAGRLSRQLELDYVLSGTLIRSEKGVRVNARIISTSSKVVVSSASLLVPDFVVRSLQPQYVLVGE
ncbi:FlgO family outer membrane protein [Aliiglaciecola lipolytica]|uniref:FlgO domain-containing protein n=1 Tax=Aliiglaciecola lipolytica E3 TaxID=1127673 RepID=K6XP59_9ALTE|nr:FlgO family outer membrane protein [Aliiglaciecola lipolytica]GAC13461.1 hypothetical protein GLIP_0816 [Aliiglaciecola lipolytica E3]